jgi:hypothetical protein
METARPILPPAQEKWTLARLLMCPFEETKLDVDFQT